MADEEGSVSFASGGVGKLREKLVPALLTGIVGFANDGVGKWK